MPFAEPAGGWLQTAWQHGPFDVKAFIKDEVFNGVREDSIFRHFVDPLDVGHHS